MTRVYDAALNEMWAMEEAALERLFLIAAREHEITDEALEAYRAKSLANAERAVIRDGVAVLNVEGALFPKANIMTAISGATSYDMLMRDLYAARDAGAKALILNVDSPGGAVNGASELAQAIYDFRGQMPIIAYIGGTGASAAYWVASAADRIVCSDTALLGSIGVQATMSKKDDAKGEKSFTFISSQSPMKNAAPDTNQGASAIQSRVDALAQVFVETVARNRGVATETALLNFGKGGIFVGKDAVEAGLADAVGSFESVLADLASGSKPERGSSTRKQGTVRTTMTETTAEHVASVAPIAAPGPTAAEISAQVSKAVTEAQASERTRISGLQTIAAAHGVTADKLSAAITAGDTIEAFSLAVAATASAANTARVEALATDEAKVEGVKVSGAKPVEGGDTVESLAASIAAFSPYAKTDK